MASKITLGQAFKQGLSEEMSRDDTVFVLGTDLFRRGGHFGQELGLGAEFGRKRVRDTPISENAMMLAAVGAALNGMRPVVDLNFIDFALSAMDEIINQAAKVRYMFDAPMPLVVRGSCGTAGYAAQHNNSLEATFAHAPGLVVVHPATAADAKGLIKSALRGQDPVVYFMHKKLGGLRGEVGGPEDVVPIGRATTRRPGTSVTLISLGLMVHKSLEAAEQLATEGIDAEVIDLRTVFPLDMETISASVRKTGRAAVVVEETSFCGVAAEIAAQVQESLFEYLDAPIARITQPQSPVPHSPVLLDVMVPTAASIAGVIRESFVRWPSTVVG